MAKDLFSQQASLYAKYRPSYPQTLIDFIISNTNTKDTAWDCATGNGQAAVLLSPYFKKIFATDISEKQISQASPSSNIFYSVGTEEKTNFENDSFDLITVAQAYHWFHFDGFFREATRVGKPGSSVAVWGYGLINASDKILDERIREFYYQRIYKYWDPERKHVDEEYKTVPFNFAEQVSKNFQEDIEWTLEDLKGYFNTWSSLQHFIKANNYNIADQFSEELRLYWNDGSKKTFSFPLFLRLGKVRK
ncbi:MAG: class I SAM-dependent methyltransferase [Bacteroidetes bacterium]|nr:class I SAM-dependent methyltransferase [Bacteroidota bacterium]